MDSPARTAKPRPPLAWTIGKCQELAAKKGGKFLSAVCGRRDQKHLWECKNGHQFEARIGDIVRGRWCPHWKYRLNAEDCHKLAAARCGKFLSTSFNGATSKYLWECCNGHQFKATARNVSLGRWCPRYRKTWTLEACIEVARSKGGEFLSSKYINVDTKYQWKCNKGHVWETSLDKVANSGQWCRICAGLEKGSIEKMSALAALRGGRCLSKTYTNAHDKYLWECSVGHQWTAFARAIQQGAWCPECVVGRGEAVARIALQIILGLKLPSSRPTWLKTKNGQLQLDGYNSENAVAFEYDGKQHFQDDHVFFARNPAEMAAQRRRDTIKNDRCNKHHVTLIRIRQFDRFEPKHVFRKCLAAVKQARLQPVMTEYTDEVGRAIFSFDATSRIQIAA